MHFAYLDPPPALAGLVKAIWCARGTKAEFEAPEPIVPDGCVEIVFNLGDRFINADTGELQPRDLLAGQMTRPVVALPIGDVDLIGVRFRPARGGPALRVAMWQLQNQLISASSVMGGTDRLADDLRHIAPRDRIAHLAGELSRRLPKGAAPSAIDEALAIIEGHDGNVAIESIAKRVGITRRHLERQFREHVGLGAKQAARIFRVHAVLRLRRSRPLLTGAAIAARCGYSDQAHLIRECMALTGSTPAQLMTTGASSLSSLMREADEVR
jgi:AraC-like DNA-binding protein